MCYLPQTPKGFCTLFRQEFLFYIISSLFYFKNIKHNLILLVPLFRRMLRKGTEGFYVWWIILSFRKG